MSKQALSRALESGEEAGGLGAISLDQASTDLFGIHAKPSTEGRETDPAASPDREVPAGGYHFTTRVWICAVIGSSLLLRASLLDFETGDYKAYLRKWYDYFLDRGQWEGLRQANDHLGSYCYPPFYMYLISVSTLLPLPALDAIKFISMAADYTAASYIWRIARQTSGRTGAGPAALALFLFLPTVVMNGALWGQCDVLYATGVIASLAYLLEGRLAVGFAAFGMALSLKPQGVFWCPFIAGLLVSRRASSKHIWIPAAVYIGCAAPAVLAGQTVWGAMAHWTSAAMNPLALTIGAPNWYQWLLGGDQSAAWWWMGIAMTLAAACVYLLLARRGLSASQNDAQRLVSLALLSALFPPFLLPGMHERYFFAADVLSIPYALCVPGGWRVAALMQLGSGLSYLPYLFNWEPVPRPVLALVVLAALGLVVHELLRTSEAGRAKELAP